MMVLSFVRRFFGALIAIVAEAACLTQCGAAEPDDLRLEYARQLLTRAGVAKRAELKIEPALAHGEAFSIGSAGNAVTISGGGPAGVLYGVREWISRPGGAVPVTERPDFGLRGTVLFLMKEANYDYQLTPEEFPWFFDRALLTRFFDYLLENRFNTIFLWSGHLFPSIVEMPEYPDATDLSKADLRRNQEQFTWFTHQCARRNISVLLHFYQIHIPKPLAKSRGIPVHYSQPNDFVRTFVRYSLGRFLAEFDSVGLYVCPGEALQSRHQPEWIRDVIFAAAKESRRNPVIVVRDWTLDAERFKQVCKDQYDNLYTELKHNVEMIVSPVPDPRHALWKGVARRHLVNVHEAADVKPFRWGSPKFVQEMAGHWKKAGIDGAEVYGMVSWRWPYALDKLEPRQSTFWPAGRKLLTLERDAIWLEAIGRYLWKANRDPAAEEAYWTARLAAKFASAEAGDLVRRWYDATGPILPGLQNLTHVRNMNFFPTAVGAEQKVDWILTADGRDYPAQPVDAYFFERYKKRHGLPGLTSRMTLSIAQYADRLAKATQGANGVPLSRWTGEGLGVRGLEGPEAVQTALTPGPSPVQRERGGSENRPHEGEKAPGVMTPDRVADLLVELAEESLDLARRARQSATAEREEADRFITDSQALVYIAQAWRHKVLAAIEKRILQSGVDEQHRDAFLKHLEYSVEVYEKLVALTDKTYINATDMLMRLNWHNGLESFKTDLAEQRSFLRSLDDRRRLGSCWVEAEDMEGNWKLGTNYPGYSGRGFRVSDGPRQQGTVLRKKVAIDRPGAHTVWARGLLAGDADRSFAVEVAGKKLPPTHREKGPPKGEFVWRKAGEVELKPGAAEIVVHDAGAGYECPDVIVLAKDPNWKPQ